MTYKTNSQPTSPHPWQTERERANHSASRTDIQLSRVESRDKNQTEITAETQTQTERERVKLSLQDARLIELKRVTRARSGRKEDGKQIAQGFRGGSKRASNIVRQLRRFRRTSERRDYNRGESRDGSRGRPLFAPTTIPTRSSSRVCVCIHRV